MSRKLEQPVFLPLQIKGKKHRLIIITPLISTNCFSFDVVLSVLAEVLFFFE
jgi:hypothetical protein